MSNIQYIGTKPTTSDVVAAEADVPHSSNAITPSNVGDGSRVEESLVNSPLVQKPESKLESRADSFRSESVASVHSDDLAGNELHAEPTVVSPTSRPESQMGKAGTQSPLDSRQPTNVS